MIKIGTTNRSACQASSQERHRTTRANRLLTDPNTPDASASRLHLATHPMLRLLHLTRQLARNAGSAGSVSKMNHKMSYALVMMWLLAACFMPHAKSFATPIGNTNNTEVGVSSAQHTLPPATCALSHVCPYAALVLDRR